ncbi:hypothetical protein C8D91_2641 [Marinicella litoralis]|uniref:Uncharacterized protein n=1 Tax=Marinicella litoralis TaxID=644220 RepID=A0A4R6XE44_9GAMM|nr:hypothetical protein C8D91_2641 [Marinicella litoralis]
MSKAKILAIGFISSMKGGFVFEIKWQGTWDESSVQNIHFMPTQYGKNH